MLETDIIALEVSQFPECGMNLCRIRKRKEGSSSGNMSQFPECGMNLCRDGDGDGIGDACECLNSLNAG